MNRWWGSSDDSAKQSAERDQRAASRYIRTLPQVTLSDPEDEYADCDTSFHDQSIFNVDGADDLTDTEETDIMPLTPAELAAQKALPFQDASYPDDDDAWKKELKLKSCFLFCR